MNRDIRPMSDEERQRAKERDVVNSYKKKNKKNGLTIQLTVMLYK
jgi:hypothetical protein